MFFRVSILYFCKWRKANLRKKFTYKFYYLTEAKGQLIILAVDWMFPINCSLEE